ncbi:uncharacterized protein [Ptychodera flava]|uniref:uncharacterized protein n=1 Tax=Ptychodera flava TaxID=63121 RepID=UPI00396A8FF3
MANLNAKLQEYLSSSKSGNGSSKISETSSNSSKSSSSWFGSKAKSEEEIPIEDDGNGWFNEAQQDPMCPSLTKKQRIIGFMGCLAAGIFCFVVAGFFAPFILVKARKFALLYTLGSLFTISSFSLLWGPWNHVKHLFSAARLPFTTTYLGSMFATLYFAMVMKSTIFTVLSASIQIIALIWYVVSYIPGGQTGLKFFTKIFSTVVTKTVGKTLPV